MNHSRLNSFGNQKIKSASQWTALYGPARYQRGVTLLEVMIAALILTIGLLGLAALQTQSLRANHSAYMRAQATIVVSDILDRMRADRAAALNGEFLRGLADPMPDLVDCRDPAEFHAFGDLDQWLCSVRVSLPEAAAAIAVDGVIFVITVQWDDTRGGENLQEFELRTEL